MEHQFRLILCNTEVYYFALLCHGALRRAITRQVGMSGSKEVRYAQQDENASTTTSLVRIALGTGDAIEIVAAS